MKNSKNLQPWRWHVLWLDLSQHVPEVTQQKKARKAQKLRQLPAAQ